MQTQTFRLPQSTVYSCVFFRHSNFIKGIFFSKEIEQSNLKALRGIMSSSEFWWLKELFPIYFSITRSDQKHAYEWSSRKEPHNLQDKMIKTPQIC